MNSKQILVFQHLPIEHPGVFLEFFKDDGWQWHTVELDAGEPIPDLEAFDALWVMGGPMDVWEEDSHPWLVDEKAAIRLAVEELELPYVGICLGHQLLASALGAEVGPGNSEVGVLPVQLTDAGQQHAFFNGLASEMETLQWHSAEVKSIPSGFEVLARSADCEIQALARGSRVLSMQYHQEILPTTVSDWSKIPAYRDALEKTLGKHAVEKLGQDVNKRISSFNDTARVIYNNWKSVAFAE